MKEGEALLPQAQLASVRIPGDPCKKMALFLLWQVQPQ